jgi:hypothetical protein
LGSAIGTCSFVENYVEEKVSTWKEELERLSDIAMSQAAYAAFTHGFKSKWTYLAQTTLNIDILLEPLEDILRCKFLPAITGQNVFDDNLRNLMGLPARLGGLGIIDLPKKAPLSMKILN